jgi:DNA replication protein DnaC
METAADKTIQEAQDRLLKKRETLNQTENHGQQIVNTDFQEIAERCIEKVNSGVVREFKSEFKEEQKPKRLGIINGLPKTYQDCSFATYHGNDKLINDLERLSSTDKSVVLRGNTGCGKTHLAISLGKTIKTQTQQERGSWEVIPGSIFTTTPELLLKIRSSFRDKSDQSEEQLINYYSKCELLILDDMGSEKTTDFAVTTLYIILDRRIREDRMTIITTNLSQKEIEDTFGARIASRLSGMENIKINMPDYRKKRS